MGFWDWLKRPASKPSLRSGRRERPALVLLMEEPLNVGVKFVQGAVEHALGVSLPADGPEDGTEFVTGDYPIFFVQFGGRLLQIKFMPFPYFAEKSRPFADGDPARVRQRAYELGLGKAVDGHQAWIDVWFMNSNNPPGSDDPFEYVGKMLSAFAIGPAVALVWPARNEIRGWEPEMLGALESGRPLQLFE